MLVQQIPLIFMKENLGHVWIVEMDVKIVILEPRVIHVKKDFISYIQKLHVPNVLMLVNLVILKDFVKNVKKIILSLKMENV